VRWNWAQASGLAQTPRTTSALSARLSRIVTILVAV
jgi:hypothetical protein